MSGRGGSLDIHFILVVKNICQPNMYSECALVQCEAKGGR